jgi:aryl-alcohol dehydrogenase-like predicted oxidoreductase
MQHALLGRTGVKVSRLALGAMAFGNEADEATAYAIYSRAREAGINFIDTADVYAEGRSEEILGRFVRGHRDELVIASKAYFPTSVDPNARGSSRRHLVQACDASLRRLATDRIDVYYLHRWDDLTAIDETLRAVDDLVRAGKILYPACSNFAAWQVAHALGQAALHRFAPLVAIQPMYNLLKRQVEVEILPMAQALGLAVVPYSPTAGGLLTGKYGVGRTPETGRLTTNKMYQTRYADPANYVAADALVALAKQHDKPPAQLAIAWVLGNPAITSVLVGARDLAQLDTVLGAAELELAADVRAAIGALTPEPPPATDRNEERTAYSYLVSPSGGPEASLRSAPRSGPVSLRSTDDS